MTQQEEKPPVLKKEQSEEDWGELFKTGFLALILAMVIRTFLYEPFNIPSQSMLPTLLVGDYLFVSKKTYGYSKYSFPFAAGPIEDRIWASEAPKRGDIIVFKTPEDNRTDFIKRLIGLPGETIQVIHGRLYINGKMVERDPVGYKEVIDTNGGKSLMMEYVESLPDGTIHFILEASDEEALDNTPAYKVPEGHYFMMGDNRDNSRDSRVMEGVGFVPLRNMVGRADILFFSTDGSAAIYEPWKWPFAIRYNRIFDRLTPPGPQEIKAEKNKP